MQAGPAKANELFTALSETSDGALKTREKLFAELKTELNRHADLNQQHLFPVLKKHADTKALVAAATSGLREVREKLAELDALPKNHETFLANVVELRKLFRQHARNEAKELLPAVQKALSDEKVQELTVKIESSLAEAERAKQDDAEKKRAAAQQEGARAEQKRQQAEQRAQQAAAAKQKQQEAEHRARDAAEQERKQTEQRAQHEAAAKQKQQETERRAREAAEQERQQAEQRAQQAAAAKQKQQETERRAREAAEQERQQAEQRAQQAAAAKQKQQETERRARQAAEQERQQAEQRAQQAAAAKQKQQETERRAREAALQIAAAETRTAEIASESAPEATRSITENAQDVATGVLGAANKAVEVTTAHAHIAVDVTRHAAGQGQEAIRHGMRAAAGAQARLADISDDHNRPSVEGSARAASIYQGAAENMQALLGSYANLGRGLARYQRAYLDLLHRSMGSMVHKQQDLLRARSPVQVAEIQRAIYLESVNALFTYRATLLNIAGEIARDTVQPLQERARRRGQD